jgi:hypothetical protein
MWLQWGGGGATNAYRILVGKSVGKRSLVKPKSRLDDDITLGFREMGLRIGGG